MFFKRRVYYFTLILFCFIIQNICGQDQKIADSLARIYQKNTLDDTAKLELLRNLSFNEIKDLNLGLKYAEELINLSKLQGNNLYLYRGYLQKGNKKRILGNLEEALNAYFKSVEVAEKVNYSMGEASSYAAIADIYSVTHNHTNAMLYYNTAIAMLRKVNDPIALASAILNTGDEYLNNKNYDSALLYSNESKIIFDKANYLNGKAYSLGNIGMAYANIGEKNLAEKNINEAIQILEKLENYYPICLYLISISDIYHKKGDEPTALNYAKKSLDLAQQYGLKEQISDANLKLSELYGSAGNQVESFKYYKNHIIYKDSINTINAVQKIADLRSDYEVSQREKQAEVNLLNQEKHSQRVIVIATSIALFLIFLLALGLYRRNNFIKETNIIIDKEKSRSDNLLLNILPAETAHELKQSGKVLAKKFEAVTVLFTDFKGFTNYSENLTPEKVVESIDFYFSKFDKIMEKYSLEKIKTMGDSYMCAGGLPFVTEDHAIKMVQAASEIAEFVNNSKKLTTEEEAHFDIRIGINTGPVVAGVVGTKKFAYDIWGDTVNIASRMESYSEPGKINVSESTYELIKDAFDCEYRGEIEVKNRGMMKMYFVNRFKNKDV